MGVQGLQTYILQQSSSLRRHRLRNTQLVVDASNFAHHMYHLHRIDFLFAGEYEQYARELRRAFVNMVDCGLSPLFVLDGAKDWSGPKFREQRSRLERRVKKCGQLKRCPAVAASNDGGNNRLLPVLAIDTFLACVREFNFPLIVSATGDADQHLASLAAQLGCPVLTNDSDFLIFDLPGGVILTKTLHLTRALVDETEECTGELWGQDVDGGCDTVNRRPFLDCEIYYARQFYLSALRQQANPAMLPLCATLIGNDYLSKGAAGRCILSRVQLPKGSGRKVGANARHKTIAGVLAWTHRNFSQPEDCLSALRRLMLGAEEAEEATEGAGKGWAHRFLAAVHESLKHYQLGSSLRLSELGRLEFHESLGLPAWLTGSGLLEGRHPLLFLDIAQYGRVFLPIGLEDVSEASAFCHTQELRRLAYSMQLATLRRKCFDDGVAAGGGGPDRFETVVEHHRQLGRLGKTVLSLTSPDSPDVIASLQSSSAGTVALSLAAGLGFPSDPLNPTVADSGLRLLLYVALASRRLLLGEEQGVSVSAKTASAVCLALLAICLHKFSGRLLLPHSLQVGDSEAEAEHQTARRRVLAKYTERAVMNNRVKYNLPLVHCISHFQATLMSVLLLLHAHRSCMREQESADTRAVELPDLPPVSDYLSGRAIYNLATDVESRKDGELFLSELLVGRSSLAAVFNCCARLLGD